MDKKILGETIIDNVISRYRLSDDFKQDAMRYVYKYVYDYYNAEMADCGQYLTESSFEEDGMLKQHVASEFITAFGPLRDGLHSFMETYRKVFQYAPKYDEMRQEYDKLFEQIERH